MKMITQQAIYWGHIQRTSAIIAIILVSLFPSIVIADDHPPYPTVKNAAHSIAQEHKAEIRQRVKSALPAEDKALVIDILESSFHQGKATVKEKEALAFYLEDKLAHEELDTKSMADCLRHLVPVIEDLCSQEQDNGEDTEQRTRVDRYQSIFQAMEENCPGAERRLELFSMLEEEHRQTGNIAVSCQAALCYARAWQGCPESYSGELEQLAIKYNQVGESGPRDTLNLAAIAIHGLGGQIEEGIALARNMLSRATGEQISQPSADIYATGENQPADLKSAAINLLATPVYLKDEAAASMVREYVFDLQQQGRHKEVLSLLQPVFSLNGASDPTGKSHAYAGVLILYAGSLSHEGDDKTAGAIYEAVLHTGETPPADALFGLAELCYNRKEYAKAQSLYDNYLIYYPQGEHAGTVTLRCGQIMIAQGEELRGEIALKPLTTRNDTTGACAALQIAQLKQRQGRYAEASVLAAKAFDCAGREQDIALAVAAHATWPVRNRNNWPGNGGISKGEAKPLPCAVA